MFLWDKQTPLAFPVVPEVNNNILTVNVKYCPAVQYLKSTGRKVSKWYRYIDEVVMSILAEKTGLTFKMKFYNEETGASEYILSNKSK